MRASSPTERAYWEGWARDLGWDSDKVVQAGEVGTLAVRRGMTPAEATDVLLARVRDGKEVRIGPDALTWLQRNPGTPALAVGVASLLGIGILALAGLRAVIFGTSLLTLTFALQIFAVVRGVAGRSYWLTAIGLAMSLAALLVFVLVPVWAHT